MKNDKLKISTETPLNVLLLGNGINRAYDYASWDGLINAIKTKNLTKEETEALKRVPYPLQPVVLTSDKVGDKMKEIAPDLVKLQAPPEEEKTLKSFASLPFDAILTGNYTYELEKATISEFNCRVGRACKYRKKAKDEAPDYETKQLHTYFEILNGEQTVWHIHGEAAKSDTMILGHYYYGKLLAKVQQYITTLLSRKTKAENSGENIEVKSWIDYFMLGNLYIVGFGLDVSELDLWWLINCKKRHFPETKIVLYKPDITLEQRLIAESYKIEIKSDGLIDNNYKEYYQKVYEELKEKL